MDINLRVGVNDRKYALIKVNLDGVDVIKRNLIFYALMIEVNFETLMKNFESVFELN